MKPLLSVCIPNYNRADYLYRNISAIALQIEESTPVEVVVADDKSKEDIDAVIKKLKEEYPELTLRYYRNKINLGFDLNVINVVKKAEGKFCWLLSNDDTIKLGGITRIIDEIKDSNKIKLFLVNYERFDKLLNTITAEKMINLSKDNIYTDPNDFWFTKIDGSYFKVLGVNTITMSCNVFDRKEWMKSLSQAKDFVGHNFIHVFCIASIATRGEIKFIAKPQVRYLANNHRTWPNDIWKDYNLVLLNFLISLGFNEKNVDKLRNIQREYEQREGLTKNYFLVSIFRFLYPYLYRFKKIYGK